VKANDKKRRECETEIVLLTEGDLGSLKKGPHGVACAVIRTLGICRVTYTRVVRAHDEEGIAEHRIRVSKGRYSKAYGSWAKLKGGADF